MEDFRSLVDSFGNNKSPYFEKRKKFRKMNLDCFENVNCMRKLPDRQESNFAAPSLVQNLIKNFIVKSICVVIASVLVKYLLYMPN